MSFAVGLVQGRVAQLTWLGVGEDTRVLAVLANVAGFCTMRTGRAVLVPRLLVPRFLCRPLLCS